MGLNLLKNMIVFLKLFSVSALLLGCTNKQIYQAIQQSHYQACEEQPIQIQPACRTQYSTNYEDYKRDREQLIAESNDPAI